MTPFSSLPLPITHQTVLILQQYLELSPTVDEIFHAWNVAQEVSFADHCRTDKQSKNEKLAESAALLLSQVIRVLTPLPFFHTQLVGIVSKLVSATEPYPDLLARLLQSGRREQIFAGLAVASAAVHVEAPDPAQPHTTGRLGGKVWQSIVEGGSAKALGKMLGMRKRNKEGEVYYGDRDPMDRPDIRHLALDLILPLLPMTTFHTHAKTILPAIYNGLAIDPPQTVYRVLKAMWSAISAPPPGVGRRIALVLLDEAAIDNIARLLERPGSAFGSSISDVAEGFLVNTTATVGKGICFPDQGWYLRADDTDKHDKRKGLHNRILSNVVRKLGNRVVDDEGKVGAWAIKMFTACPELVAGYWAHSALSLEPRLDARWLATMAYVGRIVSLPLPPIETFHEPAPKGSKEAMPPRSLPPAVQTIVESVLPSPLTKTHLSKGLQHQVPLVQHVTALTLARGLQKLQKVQALFSQIAAELGEGPDGAWTSRARDLEVECRLRVPEVPVIVAFAQKAATMGRPANEDDEVEPAVAARSAMLTEAALRLFGLYHATLPSLAGEARFDVGKLLVSASSANAERRARREAREGSVVSDSGSVGSVGTLGTVGMGGGFGHARGDVEGFEALSQLHVLRLLASVPGWNWTNKAAGSQYTYLYHILQLHLSTRNVVTRTMTTTLLERLLHPSLLFEHDPSELNIWLEALPVIADGYGAMFTAQQIHLLSFIDECVRRCTKTAHRYIEEAAAVAPLSPRDVASPLLMTMVEQLRAKLLGMHIATEAAAVVANYLRRVLVGLLSKQADTVFVHAIMDRLISAVDEAKAKGQPRHGLSEVLSQINADLGVIAGQPRPAFNPETPRLIDEKEYAERSFVRRVLAGAEEGAFDRSLVYSINTADAEQNAHHAQFLVHLLPKHGVLPLLAATLRTPGQRLLSAVFNAPAVRALSPTPTQLVAALSTERAFDRAIAETYVDGLGDDLAQLAPWIRFLTPAQAAIHLAAVVKKSKSLDGDDLTALSELVQAAPASAVYPLIPRLLELGAYAPISRLLRDASRSLAPVSVDLGADVVATLLKGDDEALSLLAQVVALSPAAASALASSKGKLDDVRLLPALAELETAPEGTASLALSALSSPASDDVHASARSVLLKSAEITIPSDIVFSLAFARLAASITNPDHSYALMALLAKGLQWATRRLSSTSELAGEELQTLSTLADAVRSAGALRVEPEAGDAEAVLQAVTTRLEIDEACELGAIVAARAMLKAGFVRQCLSTLVSRRLTSLSQKRLLYALFNASLYVSAQPNFVEPLVPLYGGTQGPGDRLLLSLFAAFEQQRRLSVTSVLKHWHGAGGISTRALDAVLSLDSGRVFGTAARFPLRRRVIEPVDRFAATTALKDVSAESEDYDPVFVLSLLLAALQEPLSGLDWVEILRSNVLGLAVCALASRDSDMRQLAGYVLSVAEKRVGQVAFHEQLQLLHTLQLVRHACAPGDKSSTKPSTVSTTSGLPTHEGAEAMAKQPRLPSLTTLFIAHALRSLATPSSFLYPLSSRFLLQRPVLDIADVPLLYNSLYSSGDNARRERSWLLRLLRDGTRSAADIRILRRRHVPSLLATLVHASHDASFRRAALGVIEQVASIPDGRRALRNLRGWVMDQYDVADLRPESEEVRSTLLRILAGVGATPQFVVRVARGAAVEDLPALVRIGYRLAKESGSSSGKDVGADGAKGLKEGGEDGGKDGGEETAGEKKAAAKVGVNEEVGQVIAALANRIEDMDDDTAGLLFRASLKTIIPVTAARKIARRVAELDTEVGRWAKGVARS